MRSIETHGRKEGAGRAADGWWGAVEGVTLRVGGGGEAEGGDQCTAAKLMPFPLFFRSKREKHRAH